MSIITFEMLLLSVFFFKVFSFPWKVKETLTIMTGVSGIFRSELSGSSSFHLQINR